MVVADLNGLKSHLDGLTSAQAVTWGVTKQEAVAVCTQGNAEAQQAGAIARTRENFQFMAAPGVMMLDHDGLPDGELSPNQFRDRLIAAAPALADAAVVLAMAAVVSARLLYFKGGDLFAAPAPSPAIEPAPASAPDAVAPPPTAPSPPETTHPPGPAEERLAAALQQAMVQDQAYRDEDLSVASLAARLQVPEYKLRRLINQRLGHRNFNAYVNGFRLQQARQALADPQRAGQSVLSIALVASSSSRIAGSATSARASAMRWRCPPDSCAGRRLSSSPRCSIEAARATRLSISSLATPATPIHLQIEQQALLLAELARACPSLAEISANRPHSPITSAAMRPTPQPPGGLSCEPDNSGPSLLQLQPVPFWAWLGARR